MNFKYTIITLIVFLFIGISYAQSQADSLRLIWEDIEEIDSVRFNALEEYHNLYNKVQLDSTLISLDYYYKLAKEKNATNHLYLAAKRIGNINRLKGNHDKAMKFYEQAELLALQLDDPILQAHVFGNMGNIFIYWKDYKQATQHFSKALKIYQQVNNIEDECRMLTNLGSVFLIIDNYELASEYYQKSLSILNERGFEDRNTGIIYINIGWTNYELRLYEEAKTYFLKGLKIFQDEKDKFFIASTYSSLAKTCQNLKNFSQAEIYAAKNLALTKELDIKHRIIDAEVTIAELVYETNIPEAAKKGENILANLPTDIGKETKRDLYELLYKCYKSQNKLDLSLKMHEKFTLYNDSIQLEKNSYAVAREAVKNDFEIKLYESKLENEKEKAALKISQLKRTFVIIFICALLIASILFYFISKIKKFREKRDSLLEEIEKIKSNTSSDYIVDSGNFRLNRDKIEAYIDRNLNETDWNVLTILMDDPVISNKEIANKAFMSIDGIGSSLRRMYEYFNIKESKYKKISLILEAVKISNKATSIA